jgi:TolB-like protein/DNA-binding SARP family transcriptional activator
MIELTTFGATELRRDGADVRSVLSQPKRLALLVYLRVAAPGGFVTRDRLLGLLWPESSQERARNALRQSLHFLRTSLGDDVVVSRSDWEVGVEPSMMTCDAVRFREASDSGRLEEAVELYRGEFLPGFFVEEAPELERWIEDQRAEFARLAVRAAWALSERDAGRGELGAAILWARRAQVIDPLAEAGARQLMTLLARSGERAGALEIYQELERRLDQEMGVTPSAETAKLAEEIRLYTPTVGPVLSPATPAAPAAPPPPVRAAASSVAVRPLLSPMRRPLIAVGVIGFLALVVALAFLALPGGPPSRSSDTPPAIAVLPFLNLSADSSNDYFADGVTEELLNVLAQVPGLKVAARTSSFAFRGKEVPIDSIARALNVTHVLEGSVRSGGPRVRITAQLIEANTGYHLWSETYDRTVDDIFAVQDEISAAIAKKLQIELAGNFWGASAHETRDPEAYRMLLRALHTFRTPSPENYATSATLLEQALQRDPGYARAHGALAYILLWQAAFGWVPREQAYARADTLARRGLALGETPEAHLALARLAEFLAWSPDSAEAHYRRALELNPSDARALQFRALFLARNSRGDEAVASARRATELDPLHPGSWSNYAAVLTMLSREDEALAVMEKARAIAPDDVLVLTNLANQYSNVGRLDDAIATSARALELDPRNLNLLGLRVHLLFQAGHTAEANAGLADLEKRPEFPRFRLATLYAHTQDIDRMLDLLEESARRREEELSRIRSPDIFKGLRHHPRFVRLLDSLNRTP